ncbi:MAG: biotin transporter BioY [Ruminococcaceae bacterium]|nr:biotin transporter BioY [Oscillospiraceae bacterium]
MKTRLRYICVTALFATLMAVGAWLTVPIGMPPLTMQSFVVYCAVWLLPFRSSLSTLALYLLMGAVGLPVFAGFQGGFGVLLGPTSGYLCGFLVLPFVMLAAKKDTVHRIVFCAVGTLLWYVLGTAWYVFAYGECSLAGIGAALLQCVLPFVLPDAAKLALAAVVCRRLEPRIHKL